MLIQHAVSGVLLLGVTIVAAVSLDRRHDRVDDRVAEQPAPEEGPPIDELTLTLDDELAPRTIDTGCPGDWRWQRDVGGQRLREAMWQGYEPGDAECVGHPGRVEHVHRLPTSPILVRRSIHLLAAWNDPDRVPASRLVPFHARGWILDHDAAPLVHALDAATIAIRACNDEELRTHPNMLDEVALHFTIDERGHARNISMLGPNEHELQAMRSHLPNAGILVRSAEARSCSVAALRDVQFTLPATAEGVDVTYELVSIQPA